MTKQIKKVVPRRAIKNLCKKDSDKFKQILEENIDKLRKLCHSVGCESSYKCPRNCYCSRQSRKKILDLSTASAWVLANHFQYLIQWNKKKYISLVDFTNILCRLSFLKRITQYHVESYREFYWLIQEIQDKIVEEFYKVTYLKKIIIKIL